MWASGRLLSIKDGTYLVVVTTAKGTKGLCAIGATEDRYGWLRSTRIAAALAKNLPMWADVSWKSCCAPLSLETKAYIPCICQYRR